MELSWRDDDSQSHGWEQFKVVIYMLVLRKLMSLSLEFFLFNIKNYNSLLIRIKP